MKRYFSLEKYRQWEKEKYGENYIHATWCVKLDGQPVANEKVYDNFGNPYICLNKWTTHEKPKDSNTSKEKRQNDDSKVFDNMFGTKTCTISGTYTIDDAFNELFGDNKKYKVLNNYKSMSEKYNDLLKYCKDNNCTVMVAKQKSLKKGEDKMNINELINKVIFNDPATIVYWKDGTKTVVQCLKTDTYSKETGLAMCILKKLCGSKIKYNEIFEQWIGEN